MPELTDLSAVATSLAGPSLEQFEAARALVSKVADVTPMESSRYLAELLGSPVFLKCENLQRTGSYKIRGAYNRLAQLTPEERARGVVAASAGNHAQGVAFAARELGIKATIFMPVGVALPKLQATRNYGADVVLRGTTVEEPLRAAAEFAQSTGAVLIPPFDHQDIVAGQGTLGLEMLDQVPDLDTVVVPIGGGGLISGVASVLKQRAARDGRTVRIIGVQVANAAAYPVSLERGEPTTISVLPTIADGIAVARPGALNFEIIRHAVDEVVTVTDDDTARALLVLLERAKLVVEPAGAVAVAAVMTGQVAAASPGGAGTRHIVNAEVLAALGPGGHVVNIARGSCIDTAALAAALKAGQIAGAALDVYESEPMPPAELLGFDNVILTPHIAGWSPQAIRATVENFIANVDALQRGEALLTPV